MSRRLGLKGGRWSVAALAAGILALASAGSADAAVGPSVSTGSATSVTATSAALNRTVNPNGTATSWHFEYGTTTAYGQTTPAQNAGSGTSSLSVSVSVSNLQAAKAYHFRIVATSAGGTSSGADATFTTPALGASPPAAVTSAATGVKGDAATLNGTVNPNGAATTWFFEYGTTTGYGTTTPSKNAGNGTKAAKVSAPIAKLSAGVTYHFRLVAKTPRERPTALTWPSRAWGRPPSRQGRRSRRRRPAPSSRARSTRSATARHGISNTAQRSPTPCLRGVARFPSATVSSPSDSARRKIASMKRVSAFASASRSTNGSGILRRSIGNSASRASDK
jgi:hypothetical protein